MDACNFLAIYRMQICVAYGERYTLVYTSGVILGLITLPLFDYMLLYCPPLDIDPSYSAFEAPSVTFPLNASMALTIAMKSQLGSWDRQFAIRRHSKSFC